MGNALLNTALKDFDKFFVGFDKHFNHISKLQEELAKNIPNYPPYNIYQQDENKYVVELAVAGFGKQDIEIEFDNDKLIVKGKVTENQEGDFIHRGIATRAFTKTFGLDNQTVVQGASMINGMLKIALERIIPEHKKARKVDIEDEPTYPRASDLNPQLLTEQDVEVISTPAKKTKAKK